MADETQEEVITSTPSSETTDTSTETAIETTTEGEGSFDAAAYEVDYGVPEGTLAGATDEASAVELIRQYTDKLLSAGLVLPSQKTTETETPPAAGEKKAEPTGMEVIMARLEKLEQKTQQEESARFEGMLQEVDRRILAELDKWESPKYGTSKSRGFEQTKAVREFRELISTQFAGYVSQGKPAPTIEKMMKQVRAFHDEPPKKSGTAGKAAPLGTPGSTKAKVGDDQPRSIHHARYGV